MQQLMRVVLVLSLGGVRLDLLLSLLLLLNLAGGEGRLREERSLRESRVQEALAVHVPPGERTDKVRGRRGGGRGAGGDARRDAVGVFATPRLSLIAPACHNRREYGWGVLGGRRGNEDRAGRGRHRHQDGRAVGMVVVVRCHGAHAVLLPREQYL